MRRLFALTIALFCAGGNQVTAQFTPAPVLTSTTMSIDGCSVTAQLSSWNWGEVNPAGLGSTTAKVSFDSLTVQKPFDKCSTMLATSAAKGTHIASVTLNEYDNNKNLLMTMLLTEVFVANYRLTGSPATASPIDEISFDMGQVKITWPGPTSNTVFCYNVITAAAC